MFTFSLFTYTRYRGQHRIGRSRRRKVPNLPMFMNFKKNTTHFKQLKFVIVESFTFVRYLKLVCLCQWWLSVNFCRTFKFKKTLSLNKASNGVPALNKLETAQSSRFSTNEPSDLDGDDEWLTTRPYSFNEDSSNSAVNEESAVHPKPPIQNGITCIWQLSFQR